MRQSKMVSIAFRLTDGFGQGRKKENRTNKWSQVSIAFRLTDGFGRFTM